MFLIAGIVLVLVLPSPWNVVGLAVGIILFVPELLFWRSRVQHLHPQVGTQQLVGKRARVVAPCLPDGQVTVDGEIWEARCEQGAGRGDPVRIVAVEDLRLVVEPELSDPSLRSSTS